MNHRLPALTAARSFVPFNAPDLWSRALSGNHCRLIHSTDPRRNVTIPIHTGDLRHGTLRSIIAQAGFTVAQFIELL